MLYERRIQSEELTRDLAEIDRLDRIIDSLSQNPETGPRSLAFAALRRGLDPAH